MMNLYFNGGLSKVEEHSGTNHLISIEENNFLRKGSVEVNSYHNYGIQASDLAQDLIPFAYALDGTIEGAYHKELNWIGIMWHPERSKSDIDHLIMQHLFD